jgi:hypothetical protein
MPPIRAVSEADGWKKFGTGLAHKGNGLAVCGLGSDDVLVRDLDLLYQRGERWITVYRPPIAAVEAVAGLSDLPTR